MAKVKATGLRGGFCSVCQRPLSVHEAARGGTCNTHACRAAAEKQRLARLAEERERERQAVAARERDALIADRPELRDRKFSLVVLVGTDKGLAAVAPARRERLRAHLRRMLDGAAAGVVPPEAHTSDPPWTAPETKTGDEPPPARLAQACAMCRGYCCAEGAESAFIEPATMARSRALHPGLSDDALIAEYMNAIPEQSIAGSCVFHGARGCSLSRDLRARICNEYYCVPIQQWLRAGEDGELPPAAVVVIPELTVKRSALIES